MAEQTAVEWLFMQLGSHIGPVDDSEAAKLNEYIAKAKKMNKQQHGETWNAAIHAHDDRGHVHARSLVDFDEYYNDTFKK